MRIRASLADQKQYARNAEDGLGWLGQIDITLHLGARPGPPRPGARRCRASTPPTQSPQAREALAAEIEQIRESLIERGEHDVPRPPGLRRHGRRRRRPTTPSGAFVGVPGDVSAHRRHGRQGRGQRRRPGRLRPARRQPVRRPGRPGATRCGPATMATTQTELTDLDTALNRVTSALGDVGARYNRLERAAQAAEDLRLEPDLVALGGRERRPGPGHDGPEDARGRLPGRRSPPRLGWSSRRCRTS